MAAAAQQAKVPHVVYSSVGGAERESGIPHFESRRRVEEHLESLDVPVTFVRPMFSWTTGTEIARAFAEHTGKSPGTRRCR